MIEANRCKFPTFVAKLQQVTWFAHHTCGAAEHRSLKVQWRLTLNSELLQGATWTEGEAISDATRPALWAETNSPKNSGAKVRSGGSNDGEVGSAREGSACRAKPISVLIPPRRPSGDSLYFLKPGADWRCSKAINFELSHG